MATVGLHVALCSDRNYFPHLATTVISLLETNAEHVESIHLILSDVPSGASRALSDLVSDQYQLVLQVIEVDQDLTEGIGISGHWTLATYLKIFLGDLLPSRLPAVLFLDSDVIVVGDLSPLFAIQRGLRESGHAVICAVAEEYDGAHLRNFGFVSPDYFNAGVMLIDLEKWRSLDLGQRLKELVGSMQGNLPSHDQDALNLVLQGAWQKLPEDFNELRRISPESGTSIIHFASADKPWKTGNRHPSKSQYKRFRNQTPFTYKVEFDAQNIYRNFVPASVRNRLKPVMGHLREIGLIGR